MGRLIYSAITSLDGYVADARGNFDWCAPDEEVHRFINELQRPIGIHLLGRRMYDVLQVWETWDISDEPAVIGDYAQIWRSADKVVYSRTLQTAPTARTRVERDFDPDAVRRMKAASPTDVSVGGPELAAEAMRAGLVDEYQLFLAPVVVGGGTPWLPRDVRLDLELDDERRFGSGMAYLRYLTRPSTNMSEPSA